MPLPDGRRSPTLQAVGVIDARDSALCGQPSDLYDMSAAIIHVLLAPLSQPPTTCRPGLGCQGFTSETLGARHLLQPRCQGVWELCPCHTAAWAPGSLHSPAHSLPGARSPSTSPAPPFSHHLHAGTCWPIPPQAGTPPGCSFLVNGSPYPPRAALRDPGTAPHPLNPLVHLCGPIDRQNLPPSLRPGTLQAEERTGR